MFCYILIPVFYFLIFEVHVIALIQYSRIFFSRSKIPDIIVQLS